MKKRLLYLFLVSAACTANSRADEQVRAAQTELKSQGFFYGNVNGESTPETTAALRRYQIRNGLEVTGTLTAETQQSLGQGGAAAPSTPEAPPAPAVEKAAPPTRVPRPPSVEESDRRFLNQEEKKRPPITSQPRPPTPPDLGRNRAPEASSAPSADYAEVFAGTPYASAPREVQSSTLRRAQSLLADRGFYRAPVDGVADSDTEEAILSYQRSVRLPLTGQLDLETLSRLQLLPGRSAVPLKGYLRSAPQRPPQPRIYRGILVN